MDAIEKNYGEDSTACEHEDRVIVTRDGQPVLVCWACDYVFPEDE